MTDKKKKTDTYRGFEQGPIRPPSEAGSLLLRLTRNCPWNRCTFCRVYKDRKFSLRPVEDIVRDIDLIHTYITQLQKVTAPGTLPDQDTVKRLYNSFDVRDRVAFNAAVSWNASRMKSIFLQDANSLILNPRELMCILAHIRDRFPRTIRITTYARSHTILRIKDRDLARLKTSGLNRIHVGMETGSDLVLKRIKKGVDKAGHIKAGLKVRQAGMELSEYVMPGLGGIDLSIEHALETASALNAINPEFIRIRTLAVTPGTELADQEAAGIFEKPSDTMMAKELRLFIESLDQIQSKIKSDHILNLFENLNGQLPRDKEQMIGIIDRFFQLPEEDRMLYQVGRRMGFFQGPEDMQDSRRMDTVRQACRDFGITPDNVDHVIGQLMKRFV